jgi:hypothetical protein
MKKTPILIIEGRHAEIPSFATDLQKKGFDIVPVQSGAQAIAKMKSSNAGLVVVNAAYRALLGGPCAGQAQLAPWNQDCDQPWATHRQRSL